MTSSLSDNDSASAIEPAIVLAAYAEPIANGRRVLFIGPAISALPARLLERGARLVHVCDPDPVRVAEATAKNRVGSIAYSALADGHFALREAAFDVCIVEDAGIADPVAMMKKVRRALTARGVALLATQNPETRQPLMPYRSSGSVALDYYALYDAVKAEFEHVRMLGQAPFVGYVIADFAPDGTPEPSLDTAFLPAGAEEPELFIAVASQQPVELEAFAVVQLPFRSVVASAGANPEALKQARQEAQTAQQKTQAALQETQAALQKTQAALQETQAARQETQAARQENQAARQETQTAKAKLSEVEKQHKGLATELSEAQKQHKGLATELSEAQKQHKGLAAELSEAQKQHKGLAAELVTEKQAAVTRDAKLRDAETRMFARDTELAALRQELDGKNQQLKTQEGQLAELTRKLQHGPSPEETAAAAADLTSLEKALAERGEHVRKLERDLREAERLGKELLRQLPGPSGARSAEKLAESELAQKLAKSQADLIATRWALEAAVKRGGAALESPES